MFFARLLEMYGRKTAHGLIVAHVDARNTVIYLPGIAADICGLMIMMMVIMGDRSVTWRPGFLVACQLLCNPSHG